MLNSKTEALGIIFPNSYDAMVPDLVSERLMASIPFASRYRMCDFILSSMVHSGIDNISIIVRKNYHSLLDHLGAGREWDLVRKNGGLNIVPPFAQKQVKVFEGRIEALESLRGYLLKQPQKYVIMTDANIAINFDFNELLDAHIKSGADVTMMYRKQEIPKAFIRQSRDRMDLYYAYFTVSSTASAKPQSPNMATVLDYSAPVPSSKTKTLGQLPADVLTDRKFPRPSLRAR